MGAADRRAAIVACSWPRAELTALSHRHAAAPDDPLGRALARSESYEQRSALVADALTAGGRLSLGAAGDRAAARRMTALVVAPRRELDDVRSSIRAMFRRLYRQRNIVVHGGSTSAVALGSTLRIVAPLFGAGFDRLVHARLTDGVGPLDLAAWAENSLTLVGDPLGPPVTALLEARRRDSD